MTQVVRGLVVLAAILLLLACSNETQNVQIQFATAHGEQPLSCSENANGPLLTDLRFYVYDVALTTEQGNSVPMNLGPDTQWQSSDVALIDLEDGSGSCVNGSAALNAVINGEVPAGDYDGIRFTVGVPESLNHADPLTAEMPLTLSAMHWHWRSGYKFMRAGLKYDDDGFWLHLGSARCHGVIGDLQGCDASNRMIVELRGFDSVSQIVVFDFAQLLASINIHNGVVQSCQMGPDETACNDILDALGIDAVTGDSVTKARVFRAVPRQ